MKYLNSMIKIEIETNRKRAKHVFLECASSSTSFPNITRTDKLVIKVVWLILYVLLLIACGIMMTDGVYDYLNYDVVTEIEVIYETPTQFPSVTFFNLKNPKANYSLDDILINCYFNDDKCTADDFLFHQDSLGYVSYSFNTNKSNLKQTTTPGKINGLQLELYSGSFEDMNITDETIMRYFRFDGFHVVVHNHSLDPRYYGGLASDGVEISPGYSYNLIVNRIFTYKLEEPHNNCKKNLDRIDSFDSDIFKLMISTRKYNYRQKDCFDYCISKELINKCNLTVEVDHHIILLDKYWDLFKSDENLLSCLGLVYQELTNGKVSEVCSPSCPLECDSIAYEVSNSFSKFPNVIYASELKRHPKIKSKFPHGYNITYIDLKDTVIAFNVFYKDLKYTEITQTAKTNIEDLLSDLGGLLGLFIGASFLSFAEIIELLCMIIPILLDSKNIIIRI